MKMLKVIKCNDGLRWYSGLVGELIPFKGDVGDEYRSVDSGGFANFVQYDDAEIITVFCSDSDVWEWLLNGGMVIHKSDSSKIISLVNGNKTYNDGSSARKCLLSHEQYYRKDT